MISKHLLDELQKILQEEYEITLSDDETSEVANSLIRYFDTLLQIENTQKGGEK